MYNSMKKETIFNKKKNLVLENSDGTLFAFMYDKERDDFDVYELFDAYPYLFKYKYCYCSTLPLGTNFIDWKINRSRETLRIISIKAFYERYLKDDSYDGKIVFQYIYDFIVSLKLPEMKYTYVWNVDNSYDKVFFINIPGIRKTLEDEYKKVRTFSESLKYYNKYGKVISVLNQFYENKKE